MSVLYDELCKNENKMYRRYFTREVLKYLTDHYFVNLTAFAEHCGFSKQYFNAFIKNHKSVSIGAFTAVYDETLNLYGAVWEEFLPISYLDMVMYLDKKYTNKTVEEVAELEAQQELEAKLAKK